MSQADVWMPLYIGDYLGATSHFDAAEHGGYLLLIMHYWRNGGLPIEDRHLRNIAKMTPEQWTVSSSTILDFFVPTQHGYSHARIDRELAKAKDKSEKARASVAEREKKRSTDDDPTIIERSSNDHRTMISSPSQSPDLSDDKSKRVRLPARDRSEFEAWYEAFPIHKAPDHAERAYWKARTKVAADVLLDGANRFRALTAGTDKKFIAHPATWLNQGRWADRDDSAPAPGSLSSSDGQWRLKMNSLLAAKPFWASSWGPKPGELGCQIPAHILAEFNLGQSEAA